MDREDLEDSKYIEKGLLYKEENTESVNTIKEALRALNEEDEKEQLLDTLINNAIDEFKLKESLNLEEGFKDVMKKILSAGLKGLVGGVFGGITTGPVGAAVGGVSGAAIDIIKEVVGLITEYRDIKTKERDEKEANKRLDHIESKLNHLVGDEVADRLIGASNALTKTA